MTESTCPHCGKPCLPRAAVCRWCNQVIERAKPAPVPLPAPKTDEELAELAEWKGRRSAPPGGFSTRTWIWMVFVAGAIAFTIQRRGPEMGIWMVGLVIGAIASIFCILSFFGDLRALRTRGLRTPEEAVRHAFARLVAGQHKKMRDALADYPRAARRNEDVKERWATELKNQADRGSVSVTGVEISRLLALSEEAVVACIRVKIGGGNLAGCALSFFFLSLFGFAFFTVDSGHPILLEKLVVRRGRRWYLVNGLPEDRSDRRLILALGGPALEDQPQT